MIKKQNAKNAKSEYDSNDTIDQTFTESYEEDIQVIANNINNLEQLQNKINEIGHIYKTNLDKDQEDIINKAAAEKIISEVARILNLTWIEAAMGITDLYQKGAHLKNVQNRTTYINNKMITKSNINQAMSLTQTKVTHRAIARALKESIQLAAQARNIPGNLFTQYKSYLLIQNIKLDEKTLEEHSYFCTDFQIDNPDTPLEVARFLTTRTRMKNTSKKKK